MREILCRAKSICADSPDDISTNYWVEGSLVHQTMFYGDPVDVYHIVGVGEFHCDYYDSHEVWPETVGQFTGFLDKNGKKIFEGDIVKTKYGRLCVIKWFSSPSSGEWDMTPISTAKNIFETQPPDIYDLFVSANLEVVGNIHDNPELMEDRS